MIYLLQYIAQLVMLSIFGIGCFYAGDNKRKILKLIRELEQ